jgi:hypothetical protein
VEAVATAQRGPASLVELTELIAAHLREILRAMASIRAARE